MTDELVRRARAAGPKFRFPPEQMPLIASIADVGHMLAENEAAHRLLDDLMAETGKRKMRDFPTVAMLEAALCLNGIPIRRVSLEELGFSVPPGRQ